MKPRKRPAQRGHLHRAGSIHYRGKPDSVYVECVDCNHEECVGVWWTKPPPGWDKAHWPYLMETIETFLLAFRASTGDERFLDTLQRDVYHLIEGGVSRFRDIQKELGIDDYKFRDLDMALQSLRRRRIILHDPLKGWVKA